MRLTKRPNSQNWFMEARVNGRSFVRSTKTSHKPTASKIAEGLFRSLQIGSARGPSNEITLCDASNRYLKVRQGWASEPKLQSVRRTILQLIDGSTLLSQITGAHLTDFVETRRTQGKSPQTIKHGIQFICAVMK